MSHSSHLYALCNFTKSHNRPAGYALYIFSSKNAKFTLLDHRELNSTQNVTHLYKLPVVKKEDEIRFLTVEKRVLKVWTYDIREKELYLDRNIRVRMVR